MYKLYNDDCMNATIWKRYKSQDNLSYMYLEKFLDDEEDYE